MAGTKEQREEWKRIGLCSKCGKNRPVEGGLTCQECRDKQKVTQDYKREHGICVKCGCNRVVPNRKYCEKCLEYRHNRYEKDKQNPEYVNIIRLRNKKRAEYSKVNGLCTECSKPVFENHTLCYECLVKHRRLAREQRALAKEYKGE